MNRIWKMSLLTLVALPLASMLCLGEVEAKKPDANRKLYKQISIMEKIIDEAMVESKYALVRSSHPSKGVYLEGLGPVFTLEVGLVDEGYSWSKLSKWLDMENGYSITREEDEP